MKRSRVLALCSSNPSSHKIRDITRSSVGGGVSSSLKRDATYKNGAARHVAPNLLRHTKTPGWRLQTPLLRTDTESRRGHWISSDWLLILVQREPLISYRYVDCFHSSVFRSRQNPVTALQSRCSWEVIISPSSARLAPPGASYCAFWNGEIFPWQLCVPIGSARSVGKSVRFCGESIPVEKLGHGSFDKIDIAFFSAGGDVSREYVPIACQSDAIAIDKSSAFRMDPHVPLVIPEINAQDVRLHRGIIANPNCTTTVMLMALYPLHTRLPRAPGFRRNLPSCLW